MSIYHCMVRPVDPHTWPSKFHDTSLGISSMQILLSAHAIIHFVWKLDLFVGTYILLYA